MHRDQLSQFHGVVVRILFSLLAGILFLFPGRVNAAERKQTTGDTIVVVIDPGHGGENNGTTENGHVEKEMTMATALAMYEELSQFDNVEVYLTHVDDLDPSLKERAEFAANHKADFLISIHYNASETHEIYGSEVWISLFPDYHNPGYQLGTMFLREFRDMGLHLRGIKTRRHSNGKDYYGIIRESVALGIPAVLVEHCHVDHATDASYCDSAEDLKAFGHADARAVAKYFGLKSASLGIDYSGETDVFPEVVDGVTVSRAMPDTTPPEFCSAVLKEAAYEEDWMLAEISASDPDSNLIYYSYSLDGGQSYSGLLPWPEGDVLTGEFAGSFTLKLEIPDGTIPTVCFRAYNPYGDFTTSNCLFFDRAFQKPAAREPGEDEEFEDATSKLMPTAEEKSGIGKLSVSDLLRILKICIAVAACLFILCLIAYGVAEKQSGDSRNKRT